MSETTSVEQTPKTIIERLGDTSKCPICWSDVHEEAYHCNKCRNFFCFHCRARLTGAESPLQCVNKVCGYYGKLVCNNCDPQHNKDDSPTEYLEPFDGYWPLWLLVTIIASIVFWLYTNWLAALIAFVGLYGGLGAIMQSMGLNIFGIERKVVMQRVSNYHSCICCEQPVKVVNLHEKH